MLEFSAFLGAVKRKERTDQYVILSALYALGARVTPVTAAQVGALLKLHLGKDSPGNVNARLRSYDTFVDPAEKGPPLRWRLTPKGLDRLRSLSGLELSENATATDFKTDVGIVCALEQPELEAVVRAFGGHAAWADVGDRRFSHLYRQTHFPITDGTKLRIVATTATSMGLTAAAIATSYMIREFHPRLVIMPGIAAGTRGGGKEFGDVLVADPSVDYNSGKVVDRDGIREFLPDPYPIGLHPRLRSVLQKYRGSHTIFADVRRRWNGQLPGAGNRLHLGPVGAADQVIDDANRILEITKNWRKLIGVEMETYGVYRACVEAPDPKPRFLSFKAVCDFAAEKTDSWQPFAAFMAAEFTAEFLRNDWNGLWPTTGAGDTK